MTGEIGLLVGWKAICAAIGEDVTPRQARRWLKDEGLPIMYRGRRPTTTMEALVRWVKGQPQPR